MKNIDLRNRFHVVKNNAKNIEISEDVQPVRETKQKSFEYKIAVVSSVIALLSVIVAAIGLIPQFKSAFSDRAEEINVTKNMSGKKVESIIQDIVDEYFDDTKVNVTEGEDGTKYINIKINTYYSDGINIEKGISLAEEIYKIASKENSNIGKFELSFAAADSTVKLEGLDTPLYLPVIVWVVLKTSTLEGDPIWISSLTHTTFYSNADIFVYEYKKSDIFGSIDADNFDMDNTNYSEDFEKSYPNVKWD